MSKRKKSDRRIYQNTIPYLSQAGDGLRNILPEHIFKGSSSCSSSIDDGEILKGLRTQAEMNLWA